jgi:hypothetical protein
MFQKDIWIKSSYESFFNEMDLDGEIKNIMQEINPTILTWIDK